MPNRPSNGHREWDEIYESIRSLPPEMFMVYQELHNLQMHFHDFPHFGGYVNLAHIRRVANRILKQCWEYEEAHPIQEDERGIKAVYPVTTPEARDDHA